MEQATKAAIAVLGGTRPAARRLGVSSGTVGYWLRIGRVPVDRVIDLEAAVQSRVTRYELRPDIWTR